MSEANTEKKTLKRLAQERRMIGRDGASLHLKKARGRGPFVLLKTED